MNVLFWIAAGFALFFALGGVMVCLWTLFCEASCWLHRHRGLDDQGRERLGL